MWPPLRVLAGPVLAAALAGCLRPQAPGQPRPWTDLSGGLERLGGGSRTDEGIGLTVPSGQPLRLVRLREAEALPFRLEAKLLWKAGRGKQGGGVEFLVGPHGFGSRGYRIGTAEARSPRLTPGKWHRVELSAWRDAVEVVLDGRLVGRSPATNPHALPIELVVYPGTTLNVEFLRVWERPAAGHVARRGHGAVFVFPAASAPHVGREVADGQAPGGRALEFRGRGLGAPLVWGHDATFSVGGRLVAQFMLRGVEGNGAVRVAARRADGRVLAEKMVRLEELPADGYRAVEVEFDCEPGWAVSFEVAAEGGVLRLGEVVVSEATGARAAGVAGGPVERPRRARRLSDVWKPGRTLASPLEFVRLERRLRADGDYEFRAVWRLGGSEPADDVGIDLWVACRDRWGLIWVFDCAAAYDRVVPGQYVSGAVMPAGVPRRYGSPVAFFAQLYLAGRPVASAWRKWGIPVDDKYIVGARRVGGLRGLPLTE